MKEGYDKQPQHTGIICSLSVSGLKARWEPPDVGAREHTAHPPQVRGPKIQSRGPVGLLKANGLVAARIQIVVDIMPAGT